MYLVKIVLQKGNVQVSHCNLFNETLIIQIKYICTSVFLNMETFYL